MNFWMLVKRLAGLAWLLFAAVIFAAVAARFYGLAGLSAAFILAVALSAAHALSLLAFAWNTLIPRGTSRRGPIDEGGPVVKSAGPRRVVFAMASLLSFALVLLAVSYLVCALHLQDSIDRFPDKPGELVRQYIDELASLEGTVLGPTAAADTYSTYAYRYYQMPPSMAIDEDQVYWGLKKSVSYRRQGREDPRALGTELILMADIDFGRGNLDAATALYKEAVSEIQTGDKLLPANPESTLDKTKALIGLGKVTAATQNFDQSAEYFKQALQAAELLPDAHRQKQVEALVGLAEARRQLGDLDEAETLVNQAVIRTERSYQWHKSENWNVAESARQLIPTLVKKGEILRSRGKLQEAAATDKRIDEVQQGMRPHLQLDEKTQTLMIEEVKGITGCLLEIKYRSTGEESARMKLSEKLSRSGLDSLSRLSWYRSAGSPVPSTPAPQMVAFELDQISIKSPDEYGFMRVFTRGRCQTRSSKRPDESRNFNFIYLMKPPGQTNPSPQVQEVWEPD